MPSIFCLCTSLSSLCPVDQAEFSQVSARAEEQTTVIKTNLGEWYLRLTCDLHVTYMWPACDLHVTYMWSTYDLHVTYMWLACDLHMTCMWLTCDLHVTYMWPACDVHVTCMWPTHQQLFALIPSMCCTTETMWMGLSATFSHMCRWPVRCINVP